MKDRRSVDELTIEELEEILRLRKRQARWSGCGGWGGRKSRRSRPPSRRCRCPVAPGWAHALAAEVEGHTAARRRRRGVDLGPGGQPPADARRDRRRRRAGTHPHPVGADAAPN